MAARKYIRSARRVLCTASRCASYVLQNPDCLSARGAIAIDNCGHRCRSKQIDIVAFAIVFVIDATQLRTIYGTRSISSVVVRCCRSKPFDTVGKEESAEQEGRSFEAEAKEKLCSRFVVVRA